MRSRRLRVARGCGAILAGFAAICLVAVAGLYLKLAAGPISLGGYSERLEQSLASRLGPGWRVSVEETAVELLGLKPAIRTSGLEVRNPVGITVVRAPYAVVSLNPLSLLLGDLSPREIELRDLHLRGVIGQDGSLSFSTSADTPVAPPQLPSGDGSGTVPPSPVVADEKAPSVVSAAAASLVQPLVSPTGLIGTLDRAKLVDARLTLVGADGRERATFDGVDALFEKLAGNDRRFELDLRGPRGAWRVAGMVGGAKGHVANLEAHGVPVADLMLLTGLSNVPATSDIKLSGVLTAAFGRDRLTHLEARLTGSPGAIERQSGPPLRFDAATADLVWDETGRSLGLKALRIESEGTKVDFEGRLAADERGGWQLGMKGRDVTVAELDPARPPFRLDSVELVARMEEGRIALERLEARGDQVDLALSATYAPGAEGDVFTGLTEAKGDVRRLVRLWPDALNPDLRRYLATRLVDGRIENLRLRSQFDAADLRKVFTDHALSDRAVDFTFATRGIGLRVVDGLPPLRNLAVRGRTTGTTASVTASDGILEMPDGRRLGFSDASYLHTNLDEPGSAARISFRIRGGFDALASLMRAPMLQEAGAPELDPATVQGNVDLQASLPFVPGPVPPLTDLGIELGGTLSNIVADRLPGGERLEDGQFVLRQEAGALGLKGEAKLGGSPATFDLRVPRSGGGELTVSATLDEAARARRGLPVAPALAGPIGVKVAIPLAAKLVPRVEADLSRAAIDGLVPGWQKPANRPGRVTFTVAEGSQTELRDVVVEAGPVLIRGSVSLAAAGGIERADLSTLRLSPSDDMRAQIERAGSGYRIALRGNNADARPLLKWLGNPPARGAKEAQDTEIDINVAILSGFNDEAMTNVSVKGAARAGEMRSLQLGGRFRTAAVEATLAKRDAGAPILSIRSGDAGATLRFLDLYRRMVGGRLALEARSDGGVQQGEITIDEFGLRGEPALRSIVSQSQSGTTGTDERGAAPVSRQDVDQVLFTRLTTGFRRAGARIDYTDAVIYGAQVGFNLSGWVDTARDRLDVNGTFVPAYLLNNAFSQLPVVGLILGGGRTEGLIAVEFRVAGALSGPSVTVNPLTAVAPGILRKLFGWMMPEGQAEPAEASTSADRAAARRRAR